MATLHLPQASLGTEVAVYDMIVGGLCEEPINEQEKKAVLARSEIETVEHVSKICRRLIQDKNQTDVVQSWIMRMATDITECYRSNSFPRTTNDILFNIEPSPKEIQSRSNSFVKIGRGILRRVCKEFRWKMPKTQHTPIPFMPDGNGMFGDFNSESFQMKYMENSEWMGGLKELSGFRYSKKMRMVTRKGSNISIPAPENDYEGIHILDEWRRLYGDLYDKRKRFYRRADVNESNIEDKMREVGYNDEQAGWDLYKEAVHSFRESELAQLHKDSKSGETAGPNWGYLPETYIDESYKRDFRFLNRRALYLPGRYFKKPETTQFPRYFVRAIMPEKGRRPTHPSQIISLWEAFKQNKELYSKYNKVYQNRQKELGRYSKKNMGRAGLKKRKSRRRKSMLRRRI